MITEEPRLQIQINDWMRWTAKKGPERMKPHLRRVYSYKYRNLFWYDEQLELFLTINSIEFQIDVEEEDTRKISRLRIK